MTGELHTESNRQHALIDMTASSCVQWSNASEIATVVSYPDTKKRILAFFFFARTTSLSSHFTLLNDSHVSGRITTSKILCPIIFLITYSSLSLDVRLPTSTRFSPFPNLNCCYLIQAWSIRPFLSLVQNAQVLVQLWFLSTKANHHPVNLFFFPIGTLQQQRTMVLITSLSNRSRSKPVAEMKTNHIRRNDNSEHKKIMITKKTGRNCEREERERECQRWREGKAGREKREKKGSAQGSYKKTHLTPLTTLNGKIRSRTHEHLHPEFPKYQHLILPVDLQVHLFDLPLELYLVPPMHPE